MNCRNCQRPMRKSHQKMAEAPGTVGHGGHGLCSGCYIKAGPTAAAARALLDAPKNRSTLEAYLVERRRRLAAAGRA